MPVPRMTPTPRVAASSVASLELDPSRDFTAVEGTALATRGRVTWRNADWSAFTGVWECDPGRFRATFDDHGEFVHVVSGEVECVGDDGDRFVLGPGDTMTFPQGWTGEWHVRTMLRKVYAAFPTGASAPATGEPGGQGQEERG